MTNQLRNRDRTATVAGMDIEILPRTSTIKYLGQTITFHDAPATELTHRIQAAWACFAAIDKNSPANTTHCDIVYDYTRAQSSLP